jgi:hypothetical protein
MAFKLTSTAIKYATVTIAIVLYLKIFLHLKTVIAGRTFASEDENVRLTESTLIAT